MLFAIVYTNLNCPLISMSVNSTEDLRIHNRWEEVHGAFVWLQKISQSQQSSSFWNNGKQKNKFPSDQIVGIVLKIGK